jgi:integrase
MASVRKTDQGRWQVRWREGRKQRSETFDERSDALKFRGLVDAAGQRAPDGWVAGQGFAPRPPTGLTLAQWHERAVSARTRASESSRAAYRRDFRIHVPQWLSERPLDAITREDVGLWLAEMTQHTYRGRPVSPKTISNVHGTLSSVLRDAQRDGLVTRNPFEGLAPARVRSLDDQVILTPDEFDFLRHYVREDRQEFFTFLFHTGLRLGEAVVLRPSDIDLANDRLWVMRALKKDKSIGVPKSARSRRAVTYSPVVKDILSSRMDGEFVFTGAKGAQLSQNTLHSHIWTPAVKLALEWGLNKKPRIHDLRHSHASLLLNRGVPIMVVSRRLGHASIQITVDTYGHLLPETDQALRSVLGNL